MVRWKSCTWAKYHQRRGGCQRDAFT